MKSTSCHKQNAHGCVSDSKAEDSSLIVAWPDAPQRRRRAQQVAVDDCKHDTAATPQPHRRALSLRPKCVCFEERTDVKLIQSLNDMTDEEISNLWYSDEEYRKIKTQAKATIKYTKLVKEKGEEASEEQRELADKLCMRGLEHLASAAVLEERRILKDAVVEAVLMEQERQRLNLSMGTSQGDGAIALASSAATKSAHDLATFMGSLDAATVLSFDFRRTAKSAARALSALAPPPCNRDDGVASGARKKPK